MSAGTEGGAGRAASDSYLLARGTAGADRLRLLDRVTWPTTRALLRLAGLRRGLRCLDLGCGIGEVTFRLARWTGPAGQAVGVDSDGPFLTIAQERAARSRLPVRFVQADARRPEGAGTDFDLAFARFLLTHLPDPPAALGAMAAALRPGGVVAVEDIEFRGHFCHPPSAAFSGYVALYQETARRRGGDPEIGPRLPGLLRAAGLADVRWRMVQPVFPGDGSEGARVAAVTLMQIRAAVTAAGLATGDEVDALAAELEKLAHDPASLLSLPRLFQAWARVPEGGDSPHALTHFTRLGNR